MAQHHYKQEHFEQILQYYQDSKYSPRRQTLKPRVDDAYPVLKTTARDRGLLGYKELAEQIDTDERRYLSVVLGTITRIEVREDRPPLSCVAVLQNRRIPNDMFFQLIEQIDYDIPGSNEEETFELIRDELRDEWSEYEAPDDVLIKTR